MGALTSAAIAIAGIVLGWITMEIACKPCLDKGREAIDHSLDPNYDPDDDNINDLLRAPLNPNAHDADPKASDSDASATSNAIKTV
ncbi:hypothetical protein L1049_009889 [Liquidambar formosana]|uniref:Outer envelope membrane protein 7 n=1 Tax=Liquidambar formosana TaxID=63359 RepID=A0AAP0R4E6_LIQFO